MINKREFNIHNMKKVLHKHGKQWIVVSAALLLMLGGSAIATTVSHADANHAQASSAKVVPVNQPTVITQRATNLHSQILNHADQNQLQSHQSTTPKNTAGTMNAPAVTTYNNNGVAKLQKLQKLYSMYEALVNSGIFSDDGSNQTPNNSNNQPVQPSDRPSVPSDNQPVNSSDITGTRYGLNYKYDPANKSIEFTNGTCNYNGSDSPLLDPYSTSNNDIFNGLTSAKVDSDCDFSHVNNMSYMFSNAYNLQSLTLPNNFDTSNVTNMAQMFMSDKDLQSLTLPESFDTSNVSDMSDMFSSNLSLQSLNLPDTFNTSNVTNMSDMFDADWKLQSLTLPESFNTSRVSDMNDMFAADSDLQSLNLPSSFTVNNGTSTSDMFMSDNNLQIPNIPGYQSGNNNTPSDNQNNDSDNPVQQTLQQMKAQVLSDINNDRAQYGQPALQMNSDMNEIANQRAQQIESNFSHYDGNGNTYYLEDANSDGIDLSDESMSGENIGMQWFSPVTFSSDLGSQIANGTDHSMMYDDASSNWGHRKNILSPDYGVVGIGTAYNGNGGFYIAEDFAANPPSDSNN